MRINNDVKRENHDDFVTLLNRRIYYEAYLKSETFFRKTEFFTDVQCCL